MQNAAILKESLELTNTILNQNLSATQRAKKQTLWNS